jgi:hypothetical protein
MRKPLSNSEPIDMKLANKLIFLISLLTVLVGLTGLLYAAEPICPGGSSPRGDIKVCMDFDNLTNCTTGLENQCWVDNGYILGHTSGIKITSSGGAAVGSGYSTARGNPGGTGVGGQDINSIPGGRTSAMNWRYYRRMKAGFISFDSGHGPEIRMPGDGSGGLLCGGSLKFQLSMYSLQVYVPSTCEATSFYLYPNTSNPVLRNNRWYLIEMHAVVDTACTNIASPHGCNGVFDLYIDEQLVSHYTDINYGGATHGVKFESLVGPWAYYHNVFPPWGSDVDFDNFAYSNTGTYIGPAASENARGTADSSSPYLNIIGANAMIGHRFAGDCDVNGYLGLGQKFRAGATLQNTIAHGLYVDTCTVNPDTAMKISVGPNSGGGSFLDIAHGLSMFHQLVNYGWVYLPSTNPTPTSVALSGFGEGGIENIIAVSIHNGKWAIALRNGNAALQYIDTTVTATFDTWHQYEIIVWDDNKLTLAIDQTKLLDRVTAPIQVNYLWINSINNSIVWGVIDYQGTGTFVAYVDDVAGGSASWWSCDGWGAASCPFSGAGTTPPIVPSNPDPIGWWKFDAGSGTTAADSSVNGNTGTLVNGPTWVTGRVGSFAVNFDGVNDYVDAGGSSVFNLTSAYTWSMWVKSPSAPSSAGGPVFVDGTTSDSWGFNWNHPNSAFRQAASQRLSDGSYVSAKLTSTLSANTWYLITATWNGSTLTVYLNGSPQASASAPSVKTFSGSFRIGNNGTSFFTGTIDEVRVYNRALSAQEVATLAASSAPAAPASLAILPIP